MEKKARYFKYSDFLRGKYGEKVYKLPVNLPGTCPNRDGTVGTGGCAFCDESGSGFECLPVSMSVREQAEKNKIFFRRRFGAEKFIAYFQAYTNTYRPFGEIRDMLSVFREDEDVVGISVSTRPDCADDRVLDFFRSFREETGKDVSLEYGLQTVNYHTLRRINRGHTLAEYIDVVQRTLDRGLGTTAHLILNLPGDDDYDAVEAAKILSALKVDSVKLHSLYIVRGTSLAADYEKDLFRMISLEEYVRRVVLFLKHLNPDIVVQRLTGKGPRGNLLFCNWDTSWWKIAAMIENEMERQDTRQGAAYDYLNGSALRKKFGEK